MDDVPAKEGKKKAKKVKDAVVDVDAITSSLEDMKVCLS
jgi:hypothetical protein